MIGVTAARAHMSHHGARQKAAHPRVAINVVVPNHSPPDLVRLCDHGPVRHHHPLTVDAHTIVAVVGFPVDIRDEVSIRIRAALPKVAGQAFESSLQW